MLSLSVLCAIGSIIEGPRTDEPDQERAHPDETHITRHYAPRVRAFGSFAASSIFPPLQCAQARNRPMSSGTQGPGQAV